MIIDKVLHLKGTETMFIMFYICDSVNTHGNKDMLSTVLNTAFPLKDNGKLC